MPDAYTAGDSLAVSPLSRILRCCRLSKENCLYTSRPGKTAYFIYSRRKNPKRSLLFLCKHHKENLCICILKSAGQNHTHPSTANRTFVLYATIPFVFLFSSSLKSSRIVLSIFADIFEACRRTFIFPVPIFIHFVFSLTKNDVYFIIR